LVERLIDTLGQNLTLDNFREPPAAE
jgi:hypothetical protein